jgi:hypothetical protein
VEKGRSLRSKTKRALTGECFMRRPSGGRADRKNSSTRIHCRNSLRMASSLAVDESSKCRPVRATGGTSVSPGKHVGLVDRERLMTKGYGSFPVVFRQLADPALRPHSAAEPGRSLAAGPKKEMSNIGKNQAPAPRV